MPSRLLQDFTSKLVNIYLVFSKILCLLFLFVTERLLHTSRCLKNLALRGIWAQSSIDNFTVNQRMDFSGANPGDLLGKTLQDHCASRFCQFLSLGDAMSAFEQEGFWGRGKLVKFGYLHWQEKFVKGKIVIENSPVWMQLKSSRFKS